MNTVMKLKIPINMGEKYNFRDRYSVDVFGEIYSNYKGAEKKLKKALDDGYEKVTLYDVDGKRHNLKVHRIVLETFSRNGKEEIFKNVSFDEFVVDHMNNKRNDNRLGNLRWMSSKDNNLWKNRVHVNSRHWDKQKMDNIANEFFIEGKSLSSITKDMKVDRSHISLFLRGFLFDGYIFEYCKNNDIDYYEFMCSDRNSIKLSKVKEFNDIESYMKYCEEQRIETVEEKFKFELTDREKEKIINMYFRHKMSFNAIARKLQRKSLTISKFINSLDKEKYENNN